MSTHESDLERHRNGGFGSLTGQARRRKARHRVSGSVRRADGANGPAPDAKNESVCGVGWLPTDGLVELEFGCRFAVLRRISRGLMPVDVVPQGRGTRRGNRRRSGRLTDVEEDAPHGFRLGDGRNQPHFVPTDGTDQREDGVDPEYKGPGSNYAPVYRVQKGRKGLIPASPRFSVPG
jgi:hypothetical protein